MAYAPHTNADTHLPRILGSFRHRDTDPYFEYAVRPADDRGCFFNDASPTEIYILALRAALPF